MPGDMQVPQQWAQVAYPSLLPLAAWLEDLKARVDFVGAWLRRGQPTSFWLAALFFPQVAVCLWHCCQLGQDACCC